jgi:anti-sigma-K factor RskA
VEEIRAYIESGVLELYVLGDISAEERLQVEAMAQQYPEIQAELQEIEKALEIYADVHDMEPATEMRDRVLNSLLTNLGDDRTFSKTIQHTDAPAVSEASMPAKHTAGAVANGDRVVNMRPATASIFYKYAFAACLLLLCISIGALTMLYSQLQSSRQQVVSLRLSEQKFTRQVSIMDNELALYRDPSYQMVHLKGLPKTPSSTLTVAWSPHKQKVMVNLHDAKLPDADKDHQFQLWAIANGKPVDLGVFDNTETDEASMKEMKSIGAAQAFAVTIEPRGGSVNPTMDQMVVMASL